MNRVSRARDMARSMARQGKTQLALVAETWLDVKLSAKQRLTLEGMQQGYHCEAMQQKPTGLLPFGSQGTGARYGR